jgi:NAD(P)H-dependent flavin oxidoreductase YrpB (nitropropane dioxygenase family)
MIQPDPAAHDQTMPSDGALPRIIQGGMGVAVSNWTLAKAVAFTGQLGVVSGTALDTVIVRRLQDGDPDGSTRRALEHFPYQEFVDDALKNYFKPGGRRKDEPYRRLPFQVGLGDKNSRVMMALGGFVEVFLAKEGHANPIGVNLLTKIQTHTLGTLFGAMLAGVDYVLMGAGIPRDVPGILDKFARGEAASLKLDVTGATQSFLMSLDPAEFGTPKTLKRPKFLPIIASNLLATMLARKANGSIEGFIVEGPTAGGHNAPPRGQTTYDGRGQPIYGERDVVDLEGLKALGLPFWLAGGAGTPDALGSALERGAAGVQVGTLFAYSRESGLTPRIKALALEAVRAGSASIFTDPLASPTGFPFKVVEIPGTLAEPEVYQARTRVCDLGYLREIYQTQVGKLGFRCASEPVATYGAKHGKLEDTVGRKCLCNSLMADVGMAQVQRNGGVEEALVTSGDDLLKLGGFIERYSTDYGAADVIDYLLART